MTSPPNHLADLRRWRGLSQAQLAGSVGVPAKTISLVERGKLPRTGTLPGRLAAALGVHPLHLGGQDALIYGFANIEAQLAQNTLAVESLIKWLGDPTARLIHAAEAVVKLDWSGSSRVTIEAIDDLASSVTAVRGNH